MKRDLKPGRQAASGTVRKAGATIDASSTQSSGTSSGRKPGDFLPTLPDLGNAPLPENSTINGRGFTGSLWGNEQTSRTWAYSEGRSQRRYVREQHDKLYPSKEFFDMKFDLNEQQQLAEEELRKCPQHVEEMLQEALDLVPAVK
jgi:hypothetical protein